MKGTGRPIKITIPGHELDGREGVYVSFCAPFGTEVKLIDGGSNRFLDDGEFVFTAKPGPKPGSKRTDNVKLNKRMPRATAEKITAMGIDWLVRVVENNFTH